MHRHIRSDINTMLQEHRRPPPGHPVSRETHSQECPEWGQAGLGAVPCSERRQGNPQLLEPRGGVAPGTRTPAPLCLCSPCPGGRASGTGEPRQEGCGMGGRNGGGLGSGGSGRAQGTCLAGWAFGEGRVGGHGSHRKCLGTISAGPSLLAT